jgi:hypothetical protein
MKYRLVARMRPPGVFGLPEDGTTVIPARPGEVHGPTIDTLTGHIVGHGTLSEYRKEGDRVSVRADTDRAVMRFEDDYVWIELEADAPGAAANSGLAVLDRFTQHLTVNQGALFTFALLTMTGEDGSFHPIPEFMRLGRWTHYNLGRLAEDIASATGFVGCDDDRLVSAIDYYQQALFLFGEARARASPFLRQSTMVVSAAFLNVWKAITTIVGDPSADRDHQSRYRKYGLTDEFYRDKIKRVQQLRDDYDVAHHSLDLTRLETVEQEFGEAASVALEVIRSYRQTVCPPVGSS